MTTAILVFVMIVITIAVFYFGIRVGAIAATKKILEYVDKALDESSLSLNEKVKFVEKLAEATK